jgi:microcystin-dependent protein
MANPFMGEIKIIGFNFAPQGWAFCDGQLLPINQNQALFSLLGTTYGGNGQTNFALPDLRGRTPLHFGSQFSLGERGGETAHTLTMSEMPTHNHVPVANNGAADQTVPNGNVWANGGDNVYYSGPNNPNGTLVAGTIGNVGGSQAHENMSPFLVLNFIIALQGIFPSRN